MTSALVALARDGLLLALALLAPVLVATVLAGVFTAVLGAVTQVRDPSVGFAPRLVVVVVVLVITAPVIAGRLEAFTTRALAARTETGSPSTTCPAAVLPSPSPAGVVTFSATAARRH